MPRKDENQFLDWFTYGAYTDRPSKVEALGLTTRRLKWDMNAQSTGKAIFRGRAHLLAAYIVPSTVPAPGPIFVQLFDTTALVSATDDAILSDDLQSGVQDSNPLMNVPVLSVRVDLAGSTVVWESPMAEKGLGMGFDTGLVVGISTSPTIFVAAAPGVVTPVVGTFILRRENTGKHC